MTTVPASIPGSTPGLPASLPVSGSPVASMPREQRRSLFKLGNFIWSQYQNGLVRRERHAKAWIMVQSFQRGYHYFRIDGSGIWNPIPAKPGEVRAVTPVIKPLLRHTLGLLQANDLGVATIPVSSTSQGLYKAKRAEALLDWWLTEAEVQSVRDQADQFLLTEGMVGIYRYFDFFRRMVAIKALAGSEMFPIPFDARDPMEISGLIHASIVSRQWLELQDRLLESRTGQRPRRRMQDKASAITHGMRLNLPMVSTGATSGDFNGALALTAWMKGNEETPYGEYFFLLGEEVFRYAVEKEDMKFIAPKGRIPVEISYYDKNPQDFWGMGLGEALLAPQISQDRQMTAWERNARNNRPLTFYDVNAVNATDTQKEHESFIPMNLRNFDVVDSKPLFHFPARPISQDHVGLMAVSQRAADTASGFRSGIVFGQQEGRTESGPATTTLSQNAMASLIPVLERLSRSWNRTFAEVLDMIPVVWDDEKRIRVIGPTNIGKELLLRREDIPSSEEVFVRARPLLPGGRNTLASILFQLRNMPGQDGTTGTEVSSREFRQSLREMNLLPPGLELENRASARIQNRINLLIGDGQKSQIRASRPGDVADRLVMENHRLAVDMLRDVVLDDPWDLYSQAVRKSLIQQIQFHRSFLLNSTEHPDSFDDDLDKLESVQLENFLSTAEADLETPEGEFSEGFTGEFL